MLRSPATTWIVGTALVVSSACGGTLASVEPPTDAAVAAAADRYEAKVRELQESGKFNPSLLGGVADEALAGIEIGELSLAQIESLMDAANLHYYTSKAGAFDDRLSALGAAPTVEGARAMVARVSFLSEAGADRQRAVITALLDHPKIDEALADGGLWGHLTVFAWCIDPAAVKGETGRLIRLGAAMPDTMPVVVATSAPAGLLDTVAAAGASSAEREPLRARVVEVLRRARERFDPADPSFRNISFGGVDGGQYLEQQVRRLDGPAGRGTLVGGPAPELTFEWASSGKPLKSLADLRGKVVVLDFWSTWCGPCVASFPLVREAAARYKGYGVEIVGVTSLQGHHHEGGRVIDCKGDPARELALMADYVMSNDITWTVAFSKEPVFNPDYGVTGIPKVVIIDAKGIVRSSKLSFHGDQKPLYEAIDKLLVEAGFPSPGP